MTDIIENNIEITENAQTHIANVLKNDNSKFFRITVLGGGCAGFQYKFDFENKKNNDDLEIKTSKVNILVDDISLNLIKGSKIDYINELIGSSFKISNPQASSSCGCGTSFSI
jgi:iron-sulfur cluster assembly accessory protein